MPTAFLLEAGRQGGPVNVMGPELGQHEHGPPIRSADRLQSGTRNKNPILDKEKKNVLKRET